MTTTKVVRKASLFWDERERNGRGAWKLILLHGAVVKHVVLPHQFAGWHLDGAKKYCRVLLTNLPQFKGVKLDVGVTPGG